MIRSRLRPRPPQSKTIAAPTETIKFISDSVVVSHSASRSTETYGDGISCKWTATMRAFNNTKKRSFVKFRWWFDWTELKNAGVEGLSGYITIKPTPEYPCNFPPQTMSVCWKNPYPVATTCVKTPYSSCYALFEYNLTPHYSNFFPANELTPPEDALPEIEMSPYDEMFVESDTNDTIVVVEGKKLHVNKGFLSSHSNFFRSLFAVQPNVKVEPNVEFQIHGVSYEDFGLLLSTVYPDPVRPNDQTAEKLLQLADRFQMPWVTQQVEQYLLYGSEIATEKLISMADAYGMNRLFLEQIRSLDSTATIKKLSECTSLSQNAKAMIYERILKVI